jgi:DNA-binding transcriptional LysR family regulator
VDLVAEGFDVALRPGVMRDDATLAARRIATFSNALYASPKYLAEHGTPPAPEALMEHEGLRVRSRDGEPMPWRLQRAGAHWEGVPPGRATANSPELLLRMALSGAGIAVVSEHFAVRYVASGELIRVLPDWNVASVDLWAVFPGRRLMPAKTRAFLDTLIEHFSGPECQALEQQVARTRH